jgi:hypothetical protein
MRTFTAAAFGLVLVLGSGRAEAFCRATTCNEAKQVCAKDAKGCVTEGTPVSWRSSTLEYHLHDRGTRTLVRAETRAVIRAAFGTWSDVLCEGNLRTRLRFVEGEDISLDPSEAADSSDPTRKLNGVFFRDTSWPYGTKSPLASTFRLYGDKQSKGTITSARIEVNTAEKEFSLPDDGTSKTDLMAVLVHEIGHFIGIGHSREPESIMMEAFCEEGNRCNLGRRASRRLAATTSPRCARSIPPESPRSRQAPRPKLRSPRPGARAAVRAPRARSASRGLVVGFVVARRRPKAAQREAATPR